MPTTRPTYVLFILCPAAFTRKVIVAEVSFPPQRQRALHEINNEMLRVRPTLGVIAAMNACLLAGVAPSGVKIEERHVP